MGLLEQDQTRRPRREASSSPSSGGFARRGVIGLAAAAVLAACSRSKVESNPPPPGSLAWALAGAWRTAGDRDKDKVLHPAETLAFFGLQPGMTVLEVWPGAGWWTNILAPYLRAHGGKLVAATFETPTPDDPAAAGVVAAYRKMLADRPDLYDAVSVSAFGPHSGALAPPGSVDLALFFHLDNWIAAGIAEKAFRDVYAALKPEGVLGLVQGRAAAGAVQDPMAANGLVLEAYVRQIAGEAGFVVKAASEINARPTGGMSGEPDRMTLSFVKKKA